ncbi:MAG TPA: hypothetical protein DEA05_04110 [Rhodobacteraceae bacterium]|jgi:predicted RNase H-like HicB family nuclease|nr:hypothetical protein [Paracoccaceae bacterium]
MVNRSYYVTAVWDAEAGVWVSESDIIGLHVEAQTLEEFEQLVDEFAAEMIVANHLTEADLQLPLQDLIPSVRVSHKPAA